MAIVVTMAVAMACLLLLQAIHVLRSGDLRMFFTPKRPGVAYVPTSASTKITGALLFGVPACAVSWLLAYAAVDNGKSAILAWAYRKYWTRRWRSFLFTYGLSAVLWPDWVLKGVQAAYPNADLEAHRGFRQTLTRLLGALLIGFGLHLLSLTT